MKTKERWFNFKIPDQQLAYTVTALLILGLFATSSAAGGKFFLKQLIFLIVSLVLVSIAYSLFDLSFYQKNSLLIYWFNIGLLVLLKIFGDTVLGSQRWLRIGAISVQPSEIAKICLIIYLAAWLAKRPIKSYFDILSTLVAVSLPAGLVFIQPDLGTTLVYGAICLGMLFWAGANLKQLLVLISPLVTAISSSVGPKVFVYNHPSLSFSVTVPVLVFFVLLLLVTAWHYKAWECPWRSSGLFLLLIFNIAVMICRPFLWGLLKDYQQKRLTIFLDPSVDPLGAGYHITQSLYAIGSGGFFGQGLKSGDLTQGQFVPEQHTDFIFSVIGEEFGFVGTVLTIVLYVILLLKIVHRAESTNNKFNALMIIGIFSMFLFHIFVNIGMNLSLMPITGVPLPFLSYGGTSLLVNLFLISLVLKTAK